MIPEHPRVEIVTMHRVLNFGSVLQAYATCVIARRFGFHPEIIDYMRPHFTTTGAIKDIFKTEFKDQPWSRSPITLFRFLLKTVSYLMQKRNFRTFVSAHLPLSKSSFADFESLQKANPMGDVYLTGSDQVWNSTDNKCVDRAQFLDFAPPGKPRIAYAASFGKTSLSTQEIDETRSLLKKYSMISVRESSGVEIINNLGISDTQLVLDPTMLLSSDDWAQEFQLNRPSKKKYLLIYSVERNLDYIVYSVAKEIGDALGLCLFFLTQAAWIGSMKGCHKELTFTKVGDFLRYFYYADFVVASSFHGTAFAINFNRQFVSVLPKRYGGRQRSLLNLVGLDDRMIEENVDIDRAVKHIDYSNVNNILQRERKRSLVYFRTALNLGLSENNSARK